MTRPSSPRVVDILADLAIQDAVDDYLQGADQVAAHELWVRERMAGSYQRLQQELDHLERTDPEVAEARRQLDDLPAQFARHQRHQAAREAVGKRPAHGDHAAAEVK